MPTTYQPQKGDMAKVVGNEFPTGLPSGTLIYISEVNSVCLRFFHHSRQVQVRLSDIAGMLELHRRDRHVEVMVPISGFVLVEVKSGLKPDVLTSQLEDAIKSATLSMDMDLPETIKNVGNALTVSIRPEEGTTLRVLD